MPTPVLATITLAAMLHAGAARAQANQVVADQAWSRATPAAAKTASVYVTLTSPSGDKLTSVASPASRQAEIHEMRMDGTVMRMRELPGGLDLPAGQRVTLAPGGYHIMLTDLAAPLKQGQTVHLHLTFAKSPPIDLDAPVAAIGAAAPPGAHGPVATMKMP